MPCVNILEFVYIQNTIKETTSIEHIKLQIINIQ